MVVNEVFILHICWTWTNSQVSWNSWPTQFFDEKDAICIAQYWQFCSLLSKLKQNSGFFFSLSLTQNTITSKVHFEVLDPRIIKAIILTLILSLLMLIVSLITFLQSALSLRNQSQLSWLFLTNYRLFCKCIELYFILTALSGL